MRRTLALFLLVALMTILAVGCAPPSGSPTSAPTPTTTGSPTLPTIQPGGGTPNPSYEVPPPIY